MNSKNSIMLTLCVIMQTLLCYGAQTSPESDRCIENTYILFETFNDIVKQSPAPYGNQLNLALLSLRNNDGLLRENDVKVTRDLKGDFSHLINANVSLEGEKNLELIHQSKEQIYSLIPKIHTIENNHQRDSLLTLLAINNVELDKHKNRHK